ncbi:MAG: signal peptidase II [Chloroflexi bacterium]|nr:signal peptidase II [Chloroflexota bacterium]|tara:strand:+ start:999 stop:1466 length:468 start_codon:yes stop_codon:yes gene_type:complete
MKLFSKDLYPALLTIILVIIFDQITKTIIANNQLNSTIYEFSFIKIKYVLNTGVAFSLFTGINDILRYFMPLAVILLFFLLYSYRDNIILKFAFSLQIAGAIGNFIDRLHKPGVIDFIGIGWWPLFNIADSAITIGLSLLILDTIIKIKNDYGTK